MQVACKTARGSCGREEKKQLERGRDVEVGEGKKETGRTTRQRTDLVLRVTVLSSDQTSAGRHPASKQSTLPQAGLVPHCSWKIMNGAWPLGRNGGERGDQLPFDGIQDICYQLTLGAYSAHSPRNTLLGVCSDTQLVMPSMSGPGTALIGEGNLKGWSSDGYMGPRTAISYDFSSRRTDSISRYIKNNSSGSTPALRGVACIVILMLIAAPVELGASSLPFSLWMCRLESHCVTTDRPEAADGTALSDDEDT
ncbi:hypothetical protein DFP72DRAFT_1112312 [Ephemerocybe angulata]|uniref:Uncharacterized protein n=1 Tax=Ephemerocybe angulata TaxID=980116 RepID=A0A8H6LT37_9AGAR|nr:hypothetical protein DFP72DRAFT_1112312 [Tulosesus angulatus]